MDQFFNKTDLYLALQSCGLGVIIGALFAIFGLKPPSPDNIVGIMGVVGIFLGWAVMGYYFK